MLSARAGWDSGWLAPSVSSVRKRGLLAASCVTDRLIVVYLDVGIYSYIVWRLKTWFVGTLNGGASYVLHRRESDIKRHHTAGQRHLDEAAEGDGTGEVSFEARYGGLFRAKPLGNLRLGQAGVAASIEEREHRTCEKALFEILPCGLIIIFEKITNSVVNRPRYFGVFAHTFFSRFNWSHKAFARC